MACLGTVYVNDGDPGDPLPIAILPIGAMPKSTFPWWRLILDCRYLNRFIDLWPVRSLSLAVL